MKGNQVGIDVDLIKLRLTGKEDQHILNTTVKELAHCPDTTGLIIQVPILDVNGNMIRKAHRQAIDYLRQTDLLVKDVDGMHPCSVCLSNYLDQENTYRFPCTPLGVLKLIKYYKLDLQFKQAVVIGRSSIVGMPLITTLLEDKYKMTVTSPHESDTNLSRHTSNADLIIVAAGVPSLITADMIKEGAILIDIGINRVKCTENNSGYKLVGDINNEVNIYFMLTTTCLNIDHYL